jgi:putative nucleotidyltransferase with HDIG domain
MLRTRVRVGPASGLVVSALFALALTIIGAFDVLVPALAPEYGQPAPLVLRVPLSARIVRHGPVDEVRFDYRRVVIPRGTVLDAENEDHRVAVENERLRRPPEAAQLASGFAIYLFALLVLSNYFQRFGHPRLRLLRSQVGLFALVALAVGIAKLLLVFTPLPAFWVPVSAVALWSAVAFDRRTALLTDLALGFLVASLLRFDLMLLSVLIMRGISVALLFFNRKRPRQMLLAGAVAGLVAATAYRALQVLLEGHTPLSLVDDLAMGLDSDVLACVGGGILAGALGLVLRGPAELAMGHVSRGRLLDLTDIESPLLRKMAEEAPGSWEHSRAMANLAEAASASIGADSLLTRVGAYYHDLGKTVQPKYFVENLAPGERSPHEDLAPEVSADAIMAHVVLGTKILREGHVPEPVVEFAYTHHGTQLVEFFWNKYCEQAPEGEQRLDQSHFRYPGMKPMSKETAILMLVDSIEAASRTIDAPDKEQFEEMIRRIIFQKLSQGQLDDSGMTLTDLRILTDRMASTLVNMYHGRIKYPWQRAKEKDKDKEKGSADKEKGDSDKEKGDSDKEKDKPRDKGEEPEVPSGERAKIREKIAQAKATLEAEMPPSNQRSRPFELKQLTGSDDDPDDSSD